jgi:hypothetical protein
MFGEFCPAVALYSADQVVEIVSSTVHLARPSTAVPRRTDRQNEEQLKLFAAMAESILQRRSWILPSHLMAAYSHWERWHGGKLVRKRLLNNLHIFVERVSDMMQEIGLRHSQRIRTEMGSGTVVGVAYGVMWIELDGTNLVWFDDIDILPGGYDFDEQEGDCSDAEQSVNCSLDFRTFADLVDAGGWNASMDQQLVASLERLAAAAQTSVWAVDAATVLDHFRTVQHLLSKEVMKDHALLQKWGIAGPKRKAVLARIAFLRVFNHLAEQFNCQLLGNADMLSCDELEYESRDQCDKESLLFIRGCQRQSVTTVVGEHSAATNGSSSSSSSSNSSSNSQCRRHHDHIPQPCPVCRAASAAAHAHNPIGASLLRLRQLIFRETKMNLWLRAVERTATHPARADDEYDYPEELPQIQLNRFRCSRARDQLVEARARGESGPMLHHYRELAMQHSLFEQLWSELRELPTKALRISYVHPMDDHQARTFRVRFENEGADDYGGPYREVFENICAELQNTWKESQRHVDCLLPLLLPSPNMREQVGDETHSFVLLPGRLPLRVRDQYKFFGQFIGMALRSRLLLPLRLCQFIWQLLVQEEPTTQDIASYDTATADKLRYLLELQEIVRQGDHEQIEDAARTLADVTWTTTRADGVEIPLRPDGSSWQVTVADLESYLQSVVQFKREEFSDGVECVREGLASVIPACAFALLSWQELQELVCGASSIDIDFLAANTEYDEDGTHATACSCVQTSARVFCC